jgi:hypothetical protein
VDRHLRRGVVRRSTRSRASTSAIRVPSSTTPGAIPRAPGGWSRSRRRCRSATGWGSSRFGRRLPRGRSCSGCTAPPTSTRSRRCPSAVGA